MRFDLIAGLTTAKAAGLADYAGIGGVVDPRSRTDKEI
jgi:hypothetical protein